MASVAGMLVFCQFWYWFPLSHFLALAFTPAAIIGLNSSLKVSCEASYLIRTVSRYRARMGGSAEELISPQIFATLTDTV